MGEAKAVCDSLAALSEEGIPSIGFGFQVEMLILHRSFPDDSE